MFSLHPTHHVEISVNNPEWGGGGAGVAVFFILTLRLLSSLLKYEKIDRIKRIFQGIGQAVLQFNLLHRHKVIDSAGGKVFKPHIITISRQK